MSNRAAQKYTAELLTVLDEMRGRDGSDVWLDATRRFCLMRDGVVFDDGDSLVSLAAQLLPQVGFIYSHNLDAWQN